MCFGSSKAPDIVIQEPPPPPPEPPKPPPATPPPVIESEATVKKSDMKRKRVGRSQLRIDRQDTALNITSKSSGINIPQ